MSMSITDWKFKHVAYRSLIGSSFRIKKSRIRKCLAPYLHLYVGIIADNNSFILHFNFIESF